MYFHGGFQFENDTFFEWVNDTLSLLLDILFWNTQHWQKTGHFSQLSDIDYSILADSFRAILSIVMFIHE